MARIMVVVMVALASAARAVTTDMGAVEGTNAHPKVTGY